MRLESLSLNNIRSYEQETINFSKGITLLSGDIGSGKSSVLYAIEFALFGARRGDLSAESLLRHGELTGSVTLTFRLNEQEITVTRTLKRTNSSVRQEPGELVIAGRSEELTALELRARILELLGYPHQLVTKAKDVLFRYTVYTPQEEMKRILTDAASHRLDVLRAVFGIDSYKIIQENLSVFTKDLRDEKRFLQGQISDLDELLDDLKSLRAQQLEIDKQLKQAAEQKESLTEKHDQKREYHQELSKQKEQYQEAKQQLAKHAAQKEQLTETISALTTRIKKLQEQLEDDITEVDDPSALRERIETLTEKNTSAKASANASMGSLKERIQRLQNDADEIITLTECPTCQQEVASEHKDHIREHADTQIQKLREQLEEHKSVYAKAAKNLETIQEKKQLLSKKEQAFRQYNKELDRRELTKNQLAEAKQQLQDAEDSLADLKESSVDIPDFDQESFDASKKALDVLSEQLTQARIAHKEASAKKESAQQQSDKLEKKIAARREQKKRLEILTSQEDWLSSVFSQAVGDIEQELFSHIHQEFQAKFMHFIHVLLEEAGIHASLDANFSPQITQDGYDVDISTLSGGERQSISLAYRLALNETINRLVQGLNTVGLLVLDEPTDGFSADQLVRVKQVLSQMEFTQLLLVSHEPHMHSFADTIISVSKSASRSVIS